MIFSLTIYSSPSSCSALNAYRFTKAALVAGHSIYRVFFYHEGVQHGSGLNTIPQDELALTEQWQILAKQYDIDMVVCIAAGLRRGIINEQEAIRYDKTAHNLLPAFELSGLGQLVDAAVNSDRILTFGG